MIITRLKPKEEILSFINGYSNIFLVGCGSCAEQCKTGGKEDVAVMKNWLQKQGKKVTGYIIPDETCHIPLVKKEFRKHTVGIKTADAVLVMACGAGTSAVREAVKNRVYPACDTISLGNTIRQGNFIGRCSLCGECVLGENDGFCPVTICPKGMLNGPCGGMDKGKCEVNHDEDCVWVKIYDILSTHNDLTSMYKIKQPKDYSKVQRGAKVGVGKC